MIVNNSKLAGNYLFPCYFVYVCLLLAKDLAIKTVTTRRVLLSIAAEIAKMNQYCRLPPLAFTR